MASNAFDLNDVLTKQSQFQAAKAGSGGLLDILLSAYQAAAPRAPVANFLMGARQAYNLGKYNKAVQAEQVRQLQRQQATDANNAAIYNQRTNSHISGPFDLSFANQAAGDIRKDNSLPWMKNVIDKGTIDTSLMRPGADYNQSVIDAAMKRAGEANDAQATLQQLRLWMNTQGQQPQPDNGLDYSFRQAQGPQGLAAGINKTQPVLPMDAFSVGIPKVSELLTGRKNEQDNNRGLATIAETKRHNTTTEGETAKNHRATEGIGRTNAAAHMISAKKAGSAGRAPNIIDLMSAEERKQYAARTAAGDTGSPVVPSGAQWLQLQNLKRKAEGSGGFFGMGAAPPDPEAAAQYNAYAPKYGLTPISVPFGNKSSSNLGKAGQNVGAKHGVVY